MRNSHHQLCVWPRANAGSRGSRRMARMARMARTTVVALEIRLIEISTRRLASSTRRHLVVRADGRAPAALSPPRSHFGRCLLSSYGPISPRCTNAALNTCSGLVICAPCITDLWIHAFLFWFRDVVGPRLSVRFPVLRRLTGERPRVMTIACCLRRNPYRLFSLL